MVPTPERNSRNRNTIPLIWPSSKQVFYASVLPPLFPTTITTHDERKRRDLLTLSSFRPRTTMKQSLPPLQPPHPHSHSVKPNSRRRVSSQSQEVKHEETTRPETTLFDFLPRRIKTPGSHHSLYDVPVSKTLSLPVPPFPLTRRPSQSFSHVSSPTSPTRRHVIAPILRNHKEKEFEVSGIVSQITENEEKVQSYFDEISVNEWFRNERWRRLDLNKFKREQRSHIHK